MKKTGHPAIDKPANRYGKVVWFIGFTTLVVICTALSTAALVRHSLLGGTRLTSNQNEWIERFAYLPSIGYRALRQLTHSGESLLTLNKAIVEKPYWIRRFPAPEDPGYILLSGLDSGQGAANVRLLRVSDGEQMAIWNPDWSRIQRQSSERKWAPKGSGQADRAFHPVLLEDGDIIFNTSYSLVRLGACETQPKWILDQTAHHSVALSEDNKSVWVPSIAETAFSENPWLHERVRDDSLLEVSLQGQALRQISFSKILKENGLETLLLGTGGPALNRDPIHINQISVAKHRGRHWERGDLLISARHMSTIFLYRPSTGKIIWHKQGPWMSQHAALFVDDHRISILNNNIIAWAPTQNAFVRPGEINHVQIYDFDTDMVSEPFAAMLEISRPATISEGRAELLPDGGLFFEESNYGRLLRFGPNGLMWSFINDLDSKHIGALSWSRYLTPEEIHAPLASIAKRGNCLKKK